MIFFRKLNIFLISLLLVLSNFALATNVSFAEENGANEPEGTSTITLEKDYDIYIKDVKVPVGTLLKDSRIQLVYENEFGLYFQWGEQVAFIKKSDDSDLPVLIEDIPDQKFISNKSGDVTSSDSIPIYITEGHLTAYAAENYPFVQELEDRYAVIMGGQIGYVLKSDLNQPESVPVVEKQPVHSTEIPVKEDFTETASKEQVVTSKPSSFTSTTKFFKVQVDELPIYTNFDGKLIPIGTLYKGQNYERISDAGNWHKIRFGKEIAYVLKQSTIPAAKADIPNYDGSKDLSRTFTTIGNTDVFDNSSGSLVKFAQISGNRTYPIIGQMGSWFKINMAGRLGYVHSNNVKVSFEDTDLFFKVKVDKLGVYESQSGKLAKVGELKKEAIYKRVRNYGNWHEIKSGGKLLYVLKADTEPASSSSVKNINSQKTSTSYFTTLSTTPIYDNSNGNLIEFGAFYRGERVYYIGKMGSWYKVELGGRLGFIHENNVRLPFNASDRYFEVLEDEVFVYDNSLGYLKKVAVLNKGQTYERIKDYGGNWHQIKYGRQYGYVYQASTKPSISSKAKNWGSPSNSDVDFIAKGNVEIFDNSSGKLIPFITIIDNERYPIIGESGAWWKVSIANRIGYIHKSKVTVGPIYQYSNYNKPLSEILEIQYGLRPQTDLYRNNPAYVHKDYISLDKPGSFPTTATVTADNLNVREAANSNAWIYGTVKIGQKLKVLKQIGDWYEIEFGNWRNAKKVDLARYLDPINIKQDNPDYFQFLVLSQTAGISPSDIDSRILNDKGILEGKGQAFVQASNQYHINEIYLISHALLETGNGKSTLANGILVDMVDGKPVEPKMVYNMFGIGAVDSCPNSCGAETAYKNGWFTPEAAIIGGAKFISTMYINHPTYQQDTIYKMRWNPSKPGTHQYATDIAWAFKQVTRIKQLYDLLDHYTLYYDVPVYK